MQYTAIKKGQNTFRSVGFSIKNIINKNNIFYDLMLDTSTFLYFEKYFCFTN
jgi:hypothetical protein